MLIDEVQPWTKSLSGIFTSIVDINRPVGVSKISVIDQSMPWLIKVNKDRCPVCGTVEKSKNDWCDPRPEADCDV